MAQTVLDSKGWKVGSTYRGRWTLLSNTASASTGGIVTEAGTINTLSGNDNLIGRLTAETADIDNPTAGVFINAETTLNLGFGDDRVTGFGTQSRDYSYGIRNEGVLNAGYGNDRLEGTGYDGLFNAEDAQISMGDGNDRIVGNGSTAEGANSYGLVNYGTISMETGRDSIIGSNSTLGIFNQGLILMGDGADTVDALIGNTPGGFSGVDGIIDCGKGNDVVKGFGEGTFLGGDGTDTLILQDGEYIFTASGNDFLVTAATGSLASMRINSFENLGGALDTTFQPITGATFMIQDGKVVIP